MKASYSLLINQKNMYTRCKTFILLTALLFAENVFADAESLPPPCNNGDKLCNPLKVDSLPKLVNALLDIVIRLGTIFVVLYVIYAGFLMVKAQGNPGEITKAKDALFYALLGGLILLGAKTISLVLENTVKNIAG